MSVRGLNCQKCGGPTVVVDSRAINGESGIRRRRKCADCGWRFSSYEYAVKSHNKLYREIAAALSGL